MQAVRLFFRLPNFVITAIVLLSAAAVAPQELGFAEEHMPLQVAEIRFYEYDRYGLDYHNGASAIATVTRETEIAVNALVINQSHDGEHFDYITEIIDRNGFTEYIHVRKGVAVPLGSQIPIDSETSPVVIDKPGNYTVKVFTWRNAEQGIPIALSEGISGTMIVR